MMTNMILKMSAYLRIEVGMKVYCNCPPMSMEDPESDRFFRNYGGRTGTVVGFSTEYVGPLDSKGRLPGVYYRPGGISVQFDGEEKVFPNLNINHFVLVNQATTVDLDMPLTHQWAGDLPNPIEFYVGDIVHKVDDLLRQERTVTRVTVNDNGIPVYTLAETEESRVLRMEALEQCNQERREKGDMILWPRMSSARSEDCFGDELALVTAGNIHWLYVEPARMHFDSAEEEVYFWARDGLAERVFSGGDMSPFSHIAGEFSLEEARRMLEDGEGDLIVRLREFKNLEIIGRSGDYMARLLHPCFEQYREHVRSLALALETPPNEGEEWSMEDLLAEIED